MMRQFAVAMTALLMSAKVLAADVTVENPWVREAPPGAMAMGGFMVLRNQGAEDVALTGAACDGFDKVELHRTVQQDGLAKMIHQKRIEIPAGGSVEFKPGDYHIMLIRPKQQYSAGDELTVTLQFSDGTSKTVTYPVKPGMGMKMGAGHGAMHHGMGH